MQDNMTAMEVVNALTVATAWSKTFSRQFLSELIDVIVAGLERDGEVRVRGLGLFRSKRVEERIGRNPRTGEALVIPAHYNVQFTPEKSLRELVNRRNAHLKPSWIKEKSTPEPQKHIPPPVAAVVTKSYRRKSLSGLWLVLLLGAIPILWCLLHAAGWLGGANEKNTAAESSAMRETTSEAI